jgi:hypothetical protein
MPWGATQPERNQPPMFDVTTTADNVSRWTGFGIKLPEELDKAIEIFEVLRWVEVGRLPVFDLTAVTPQNAEDLIRKYADDLAVSASPDANGMGHSVLEKAKKNALELAARNVIRLAGNAVPDAIEQLSPAFDQHADAYIAAVAKLPEKIDADTLLSAGTNVVESYHAARQHAANLNVFSNWIANTLGLPLHGGQHDPVLRILRPVSITQLVKLDAAHNTPSNPALTQLDPVLFTAAREGVEFAMNTIRECTNLRRDLETVRPQKLQGVATTNDFR